MLIDREKKNHNKNADKYNEEKKLNTDHFLSEENTGSSPPSSLLRGKPEPRG